MEIKINIERLEISDVNIEEEKAGENVISSFNDSESAYDPYKYAATVEAMQEAGNLEQAIMYDTASAEEGKVKVVTFLDRDIAHILETMATQEQESLSAILSHLLLAASIEEAAYDKATDIHFPHPEEQNCTDGFCVNTNVVQHHDSEWTKKMDDLVEETKKLDF